MVFTVVLVTEHDGRRLSVDLDFPACPTVATLRAEAAKELSDQGYPPLQALQVRGPRGDPQEVVSGGQLRNYGEVQAVLAAPLGSAAGRSAVSFLSNPAASRESSRADSQSTAVGAQRGVVSYRGPSPATAPSERGRSVRSAAAAALDPQAKEEEQVNFVFDHLDTNRTRAIRKEAFVAAFSLIPSLKDSAADIFWRCDANKDGVLDVNEFRQFTRMYPTLLDAFYYRIQDGTMYSEQMAQLARQAEQERQQQEIEAKNLRLHQEAQGETQACNERLNRQAAALAASVKKEQAAKKSLEQTRAGAAAASRALQDAAGKSGQFSQMITEHQTAVEELGEEVGRRRECLEGEQAAHNEQLTRLAEIQRMLEEQTRVVQQHQERVAQAGKDLDVAVTSVDEEQGRLEACRADAQQHAAAIQEHENVVAARVEEERAAAARHRDTANEVARVQAKRDLLEREQKAQHEKEAVYRTEHRNATAALNDTRKKIQAMKQENSGLVSHMEQVEREEKPLLQQEVDLRNKKDDIERFEANLRNEHRQFASRNARKQTVSTSFAR